jgi:hypothetical protein
MKKYTIKFTRKQLESVREACEFLSRFSSGQFELPVSFDWEYLHEKWGKDYLQKRKRWEKFLSLAKQEMFDRHENECLGIGHPELTETAKICYDIYRPICEKFAEEMRKESKKKGEEIFYTVYDFPGLPYSNEGRIKVE